MAMAIFYRILIMSGAATTRPKVPEGKAPYLTTTQMEIKPDSFVGYTTTWAPFQKEVKYEIPKKP